MTDSSIPSGKAGLFEALLDKPLDSDQMQAVKAGCNTVVSAGAGSGKTTVLSYRFLRLLLENRADVDEILTLTFTRKAAAEMHERIHSLLAGYRDDPGIARQLQQFDKARIATLDSFCASIVRSDNLRYGIANDFTQDDDRCRKLARETAEEMILESSSGRLPGLRTMVRLHKVDSVIENLLLPIAVRFSSPAGRVDFPQAAEERIAEMTDLARDFSGRLQQSAGLIETLDGGAGKTIRTAQATCRDFLDVVPSAVDTGDWLLLTYFLDGIKLWTKPRGKHEDLLTLAEETVQWKDIFPLFALVCALLAETETLRQVSSDIDRFQKRFMERKRQAGILTFSDIAGLAVDILRNNRTVRSYYKKRFKYIMIDEFQDNNDLQRQMLFLLAEKQDRHTEGIPAGKDLDPEKLFFVGDEKQSIYRFRGADVSVFKHLKHTVGSMGGQDLTLNRNYRSRAGLISCFNSLFTGIMESPDTESADYEAEFQSLEAGNPSTLIRNPVQISIFARPECGNELGTGEEDSNKGQGADEVKYIEGVDAEALYIARYIHDAVSTGSLRIPQENEAGQDGTREIAYSDFALLLRATSNQMRYERALRAVGVPYTVQSARALYLEAPVNDIYQLLQLAVYPLDRHAYAAILRSPFVQLSDTTVFSILAQDPCRAFSEGTLCRIASEEERKRFAAADSLYREIRAMADSVSLSMLIRYIWYEGGYRWFLLKDGKNHAYLEYFDFIKGLADKADDEGLSLAEFLDQLRPRLGSSEKTDEIDLFPLETAGVQVMTVHKSKGLEFPAVIIADAGNSGKTATEPVFYPGARGDAPSFSYIPRRKVQTGKFSSNCFYFLEKEENLRRSLAEMKRMLYVAMTRAEQHLLITGRWSSRNSSTGTGESIAGSGNGGMDRNFLALLVHALGLETGVQEYSSPDGDIIINPIPAYTEDDYYHLTRGGDSRGSGSEVPRESAGPGRHGTSDRIAAAAALYRSTEVFKAESKYIRTTATEQNSSTGNSEGWHGSTAAELPGISLDNLHEKVPAADFGTYCHALVEKRIHTLANSCRKSLRDTGEPGLPASFTELPVADREQLIRDAEMLAGNLFAAGFMQDVLGNPEISIESEVPFLLRRREGARELLIHGKIDILIEYSDHAVVLDLKTDRFRNPDEYRVQLGLYLEAVREITKKKCKGTIVYLRDPEVLKWIE